MRQGSIAQSSLAKRHKPETIARLEASLANIAAQISIGPDIAARHPGVSALGMQRLLDTFRGYKGDVENLLPAAVDSQDSYDRFVTIMRRINQYLFPAFTPDGIIPLHALIVVQWLKGFSLSRMIERNIDYHRRTRRSFKLPVLIRSSRVSAVALYEKIARDDLNKEDCIAWVRERDTQFEGMDLPAIILREIRAKLLLEDSAGTATSAS